MPDGRRSRATPGLGKSRLARELVERLRGTADAVGGQCLAYGEGTTYWPVAEIVRSLTSGAPPEEGLRTLLADERDGDVLARSVAAALGLVEGGSDPSETLLSVRRLLEAVARDAGRSWSCWTTSTGPSPRCWTWPSTSPPSPRGRCCCSCLARPDLLDERPAWSAPAPGGAVLKLAPLGADDAGTLLGHRLGERELPDEARGRMIDAAEGNPLFLEQLLALSLEAGVPAELAIPERIQLLLAARIDALAGDERAVLERAAVEGASFHRGSVVALLPQAEREKVDSLLLAARPQGAGAAGPLVLPRRARLPLRARARPRGRVRRPLEGAPRRAARRLRGLARGTRRPAPDRVRGAARLPPRVGLPLPRRADAGRRRERDPRGARGRAARQLRPARAPTRRRARGGEPARARHRAADGERPASRAARGARDRKAAHRRHRRPPRVCSRPSPGQGESAASECGPSWSLPGCDCVQIPGVPETTCSRRRGRPFRYSNEEVPIGALGGRGSQSATSRGNAVDAAACGKKQPRRPSTTTSAPAGRCRSASATSPAAAYFGPRPAADAIDACTELLERARSTVEEANVLRYLGALESLRGEVDRGRALVERSTSQLRAAGRWGSGNRAGSAGPRRASRGSLCRRAAPLGRERENALRKGSTVQGFAACELAACLYCLQRYEDAGIALPDEGSVSSDDVMTRASLASLSAQLRARRGDDDARALAESALALAETHGHGRVSRRAQRRRGRSARPARSTCGSSSEPRARHRGIRQEGCDPAGGKSSEAPRRDTGRKSAAENAPQGVFHSVKRTADHGPSPPGGIRSMLISAPPSWSLGVMQRASGRPPMGRSRAANRALTSRRRRTPGAAGVLRKRRRPVGRRLAGRS